MGISSGSLNTNQIYFSSKRKQGEDIVMLNSQSGWRPSSDSEQEYVVVRNLRLKLHLEKHFFLKVDFEDMRYLSGIKMQGFYNKPFWVEAFKVRYSTDGHVWNTVREKHSTLDRIFVGNFDSGTVLTQYFDSLIFARYIRVHPTKWHQSIGLRFEIIGCYDSQATVSLATTTTTTTTITTTTTTATTTTTTTTSTTTTITTRTSLEGIDACNVCPGLPGGDMISCSCTAGLAWDGRGCVNDSQCPCYHNSLR